jgi:hypothetical protein
MVGATNGSASRQITVTLVKDRRDTLKVSERSNGIRLATGRNPFSNSTLGTVTATPPSRLSTTGPISEEDLSFQFSSLFN